VETTDRERTTARTFQPELRLPEDEVLPQEMYAPAKTPTVDPTDSRPAVVRLFG
jgi:hypothetical protein